MRVYIIIILIISSFWNCENRSRNNPVFLWMMGIVDGSVPTVSNNPVNTTSTSPANTNANTSSSIPEVNTVHETQAPSDTNETTQSKPATEYRIPFNMQINDVVGETEFLFNSLEQMSVQVAIQDTFNTDVNAVVRIIKYGDDPRMILFQAIPDQNGNVSGTFTYDVNQPMVVLELIYNGQVYSYEINLSTVVEINRLIKINGTLAQVVEVDSDGDGVSDKDDVYPNDPSRSSKTRIPFDSYSTVAFEDLYPVQGDADFNDYVLKVSNEEDLNQNGKIVRIRGDYEHIARGAGYKHKLLFRLPESVVGSYHLKRFSPDGILENEISGTLNGDIEILPSSETTLSGANSKIGETIKKGKKAVIEIIFENPVDRATLGSAPYDLFLNVITTKKEIHFLGRYKNEDGTDKYLDSNGFPWAILIPGVWKYPYEKVDIRNSYENFKPWYESKGETNKNWYNSPNLNYVFPVVE